MSEGKRSREKSVAAGLRRLADQLESGALVVLLCDSTDAYKEGMALSALSNESHYTRHVSINCEFMSARPKVGPRGMKEAA